MGGADETRSSLIDPARLRKAAAELTVPTLLVRGRVSDLLSEEGARELLELVPHAQMVDVAGAGHMVAGTGTTCSTTRSSTSSTRCAHERWEQASSSRPRPRPACAWS